MHIVADRAQEATAPRLARQSDRHEQQCTIRSPGDIVHFLSGIAGPWVPDLSLTASRRQWRGAMCDPCAVRSAVLCEPAGRTRSSCDQEFSGFPTPPVAERVIYALHMHVITAPLACPLRSARRLAESRREDQARILVDAGRWCQPAHVTARATTRDQAIRGTGPGPRAHAACHERWARAECCSAGAPAERYRTEILA
jgi:hypothetical protein